MAIRRHTYTLIKEESVQASQLSPKIHHPVVTVSPSVCRSANIQDVDAVLPPSSSNLLPSVASSSSSGDGETRANPPTTPLLNGVSKDPCDRMQPPEQTTDPVVSASPNVYPPFSGQVESFEHNSEASLDSFFELDAGIDPVVSPWRLNRPSYLLPGNYTPAWSHRTSSASCRRFEQLLPTETPGRERHPAEDQTNTRPARPTFQDETLALARPPSPVYAFTSSKPSFTAPLPELSVIPPWVISNAIDTASLYAEATTQDLRSSEFFTRTCMEIEGKFNSLTERDGLFHDNGPNSVSDLLLTHEEGLRLIDEFDWDGAENAQNASANQTSGASIARPGARQQSEDDTRDKKGSNDKPPERKSTLDNDKEEEKGEEDGNNANTSENDGDVDMEDVEVAKADGDQDMNHDEDSEDELGADPPTPIKQLRTPMGDRIAQKSPKEAPFQKSPAANPNQDDAGNAGASEFSRKRKRRESSGRGPGDGK